MKEGLDSAIGRNMAGDAESEFRFWAETAKIRAEEILKTLNPKMAVRLFRGVADEELRGAEYDTWFLDFEHPDKPGLKFVIEVERNEDFISEKLPKAIQEEYLWLNDKLGRRPQAAA
jgi:hypothetical protein